MATDVSHGPAGALGVANRTNSWLARRRIRAYFVVLVGVVVTTAIAASWIVRSESRSDSQREAFADAQFAAATSARELGEYLALVRSTVDQLAANPGIAQALEHPAGCSLTFSGLASPDRSHLDVVDAAGKVMCSSRTSKTVFAGYAGAAWLSESLRAPQLRAPQLDAASGAHAAVITAPIPGRKGAIAAFVDLDATGPALSKLYSGSDPQEVLITSADGSTVLTRSIAPRRWIGHDMSVSPLARHFQTTQEKDLDGTSRFYAQSTMQPTGWRVLAGRKVSAALAANDRLERREFAIIVAGLLAALIAAAIAHRSLVTPLRRLSGSLQQARETSAAIEPSGPLELRRLTEHVNDLVASVQRELGERENAENQLEETARSYRLLFEANPSPMWVFDTQTLRFLAVNNAAVETYGYSREEFLAMTIEDIRPPDERDRLRTLVLSSDERRGYNLAGVWRHRRSDGSLFDVEIVSQDHEFEGRPGRIVLALDITQRFEAEQALRRSEAKYRDLFENATDLIATVDLEARFTNVNAAFTRTLGYEREELIGQPLTSIVPERWHDQLATARGEKLDHDRSATIYAHELIAKDGRLVPVEVASRVVYENGRPVGVEAVCRDLSERHQLEEQLRQAQRLEAVGQLAGGIAHDFNNLLTVISGYSEVLIARSAGQPEPALTEIRAAAERAATLTRQLLAFSRRQVLQPKVIELNKVVDGISPMLQRLIPEHVELAAVLDPAAGHVLADPSQVEQVIVNLVVNARDAMPDGGKLTISTALTELDESYVEQHPEAKTGPHAVLAVTDTGIGMDSETMSRIFEPFFTTKAPGTGTGLGLATVYGIVKQSSGTIWAYSEPGHGTTFKVYLPATAATDGKPVETTTDAPPVPTGVETILVVEDEPAVRDLVVEMLEERGYTVLAAKSATDAIEIAGDSNDVALLLTDLVMPHMNGQELASKVREHQPSIRLLFMSGYADEAVTRHGALAPEAAFIEKPFSSKRLAMTVRGLLDSGV